MGKNELHDEAFFQRLVEDVNSEIFVCDSEGTIIYMNPVSEYLTGKKREQLIGTNICKIIDDKVISYSVTQEVIKTGKISKALQKTDNNKDLLAIGTPIFNDKKELIYVVTTAYDVGELSEINSKLAEENRKLQMQMAKMSFYKDQYFSDDDQIFTGKIMESLMDTIGKIASLDVMILILGETGVGKEAIAKLIHRLGRTSDTPFVKINCGIIPESLFESELFGYENGSFTGALRGGKIGKVELANGGTLFLDEIGDLPLAMQVKLLEFLQEQTIVRVGGVKRIPIQTRIIAATHRDLKEMVAAGTFRKDLYYRLNVLPIEIPPLRERRNEIIHLAQFILHKCNLKYSAEKSFDNTIIASLNNYDWPGNIRELEHIIERLYVTSSRHILTAKDLFEILGDYENIHTNILCTELMPLKAAKQEVEIQLAQRACKEGGSTYQAAKLLEVDQSTIVKILKRHKERESTN